MPVIAPPPPIFIAAPPPPFIPAPPAAAAAAVVFSVAAAAAVAAAAYDAYKAQEEADRNIRKLKEPNYGSKPRFREDQIPPGGQFTAYGVIASAEYTGGNSDGVYYFNRGNRSGSTNLAVIKEQTTNFFPIQGKITAISDPANQNGSWRLLIDTIDSNGNQAGWSIAVADSQNFSSSLVPSSLKIHEIYRIDGQPDGGTTSTKVGDSYTPTPNKIGTGTGNPETDRRNAPPPPFDLSKLNIGSKIGSTVGSGGGVTTNNVTNNISSFNASSVRSLNIGAALGFGASPTVAPPPPAPTPPPTPTPTPPPKPDKKEEDKKFAPPPPPAPAPTPPPAPNLNGIAARLGEMGAILNLIWQNTTPEKQEQISKKATCDTLQSDPCTKKLKDDIKNPINQNVDAKTAALAANQAAQDVALAGIAANQVAQNGVLAGITNTLGNVWNFLNRVWANEAVNKVMNALTLFTVLHNAAMLSSSIAETLGSAIDQGLAIFGFQLKDKEGNQIGVTTMLGQSVQNFVKGVIGEANYTALTTTWAQANRIYQAGVNLLSNVQSILDSTTAVAELTSNRVATLMNGLRNAGMVREDAYGSQTPNTTRFNAFMQKLENLEQGTSNLAAITGNIQSVQQSVNEIKQNRTEFENAIADKNTQEETAKTERRQESIFKINDFSIVRAEEEAGS